MDDLDLERAVTLLSLPRLVGNHPEDGEPIEAAIGRYGPYVRHGKVYANLPEVDEVFTIGMNRAMEVLAQKAAGRGRGRAAAKALVEVGEHPDGGTIAVMEGRYGPYVKWDKVNATIPKDMKPEEVNLDVALELIAEKQAKSPGKKPAAKKASAKKAAPRKAAAEAAKKPAARKGAAKTAKGKGGKAPARKSPAREASSGS